MKLLIPILILIVIAGAGYYLFTINPSSPVPVAQTLTPQPSMAEVTELPVEDTLVSAKKFTIDAQNYSFAPRVMTVNLGDQVEITLNNTGGSHDLVIDEFNAKTPIVADGETAVLTFTADQVGEFAYYCSVGNHRAMGMEGSIVVLE